MTKRAESILKRLQASADQKNLSVNYDATSNSITIKRPCGRETKITSLSHIRFAVFGRAFELVRGMG